MNRTVLRRSAGIVASVAAAAAIVAGCDSNSGNDTSASPSEATSASAPAVADVKLKGADGTEVTLSGPIAAKYSALSAEQKKDLGVPLTGDRNAGTRSSGVVFQQFKGGVITAKNKEAGTPAYITWGKIRDAWNVNRAPDGKPSATGKNGSAGPLGAATSDEFTVGHYKRSNFEHGKIVFNTTNGKVTVTVNGKVVPTK
ncbi:LGFP repeat-containing protein [Gordonia crocea]|uniref:LGFP repeat-containing protein n=1 Tax=Gordonia crocea TaxID=589162 RepID=A0A7I9UXY6_9ACTN|nr:hypothetical protein [Gordonia crocea]GED97955.1 hypothetical protein nbrc107697_19940 [Gordonia crocea]